MVFDTKGDKLVYMPVLGNNVTPASCSGTLYKVVVSADLRMPCVSW